MNTKQLAKQLFDSTAAWGAALLLGVVAATIDLRADSRVPYIALLVSSTLILTLCQPRWAWRWLVVALCEPVLVLLTGHWGPYRFDRFDVFYGVVPAAVGILMGLIIRRSVTHAGRLGHS
jgi:hypothetical protein